MKKVLVSIIFIVYLIGNYTMANSILNSHVDIKEVKGVIFLNFKVTNNSEEEIKISTKTFRREFLTLHVSPKKAYANTLQEHVLLESIPLNEYVILKSGESYSNLINLSESFPDIVFGKGYYIFYGGDIFFTGDDSPVSIVGGLEFK